MPAAIVEVQHGDYLISTDPARLDVVAVHRFISEESYWAQGRAYEVQRRAIEHSALVVGAYASGGEQVGFARMVTDLATWAWLCDVYVRAQAGRPCSSSEPISSITRVSSGLAITAAMCTCWATTAGS